MGTNRRKFISKTILGGLGAATLPLSSLRAKSNTSDFDIHDPISKSLSSKYAKLDQILKQPVFKREFFLIS